MIRSMKRYILIFVTCLSFTFVFAEHITGGEMFYQLTGVNNGVYNYHVTLKLYRDCNSTGAPLDPFAYLTVVNKTNGQRVWTDSVKLNTPFQTLQLSNSGCVMNPPTVCYQVGYYEFNLSLPATASGYTIAYQRCCRISGISNLSNSGNAGATYTAEIPGTSSLPTAPSNNSARFIGKDTIILCGGYKFNYNFGATDIDGDVLRYSFCSAYTGATAQAPQPYPPGLPPYSNVSYAGAYSGSSPLGPGVTIDPVTGIISGFSPPSGIYVVTVCVSEIRNGIVIATQRKDLQVKVGFCDIPTANLKNEYKICKDLSYTFTPTPNPLVVSYYWDFGDPATGANNTSTAQNPTHVFSSPGNYTIKLIVNRNGSCPDSATAIARVWPGFTPDFSTTGICIANPVLFNDRSTSVFGVVNSWQWDFGDANSITDISTNQDSAWQYSSIGPKNIRLIVGDTRGCLDTIIKSVTIIDKPPITLAFRDTLICVPDALQLQASGTGNFSWTPTSNIVNANTATPTVNPTTTTWYHVQLDEQGCINNDSVQVRVVTFVTLAAMPDTTICLTDTAQLRVVSDGLRYQWTPAATLNNSTLKNPIARPTATTTYQVIARIGSCVATDDVIVNTVPYPVANAGNDTLICYNTPAYLHGSHDGSSFVWTPISSLINGNTLTPTAYPARTTPYVLSSYDTKGCPKPGRDTVLVTVLPKIIPFAGNDTAVIVGQPLQLNAQGGTRYVWSPATGLNNPNINNPVGIYSGNIDSITYVVSVYNQAGCVDTDTIKVKVFKTGPTVFVPSAFTPNGDGLNDVLRPIAVGIREIKYFSVFNRWGQMVFNTTTNGQGWDGRIGGALQSTNVFVWMVSAIDYTGKPLFLKGTFTLIR